MGSTPLIHANNAEITIISLVSEYQRALVDGEIGQEMTELSWHTRIEVCLPIVLLSLVRFGDRRYQPIWRRQARDVKAMIRLSTGIKESLMEPPWPSDSTNGPVDEAPNITSTTTIRNNVSEEEDLAVGKAFVIPKEELSIPVI
jgi:hypothetical protein